MDRLAKLASLLASHHQPSYRFKQISQSIFSQGVTDFDRMFFLPKELRQLLRQELGESFLAIVKESGRVSSQGEKVVFSLTDGRKIESVRLVYRSWQSVCLSSQVGCASGCVFCATGQMGLLRNLTVDEIIDQLLYFRLSGQEIETVSFMGMGEPLANPNFFKALKIVTDPELFGFSQRKVNVSTVGILPALEELVDNFPAVNVAFSLNSPFPEQRQQLMAIENKFPFKKVFPVLNHHIRQNRRKVFLSYVVLAGINDTPAHVRGLAQLIQSQQDTAYLYHLNLINYHPVSGSHFFPSSSRQVAAFRDRLEKAGLKVTIRRSVALPLQGACGQLRT